MKQTILGATTFMALCFSAAAFSQTNGSLDAVALNQIKSSYKNTLNDQAIRNAIANCDIKTLATSEDNKDVMDTYFSVKVNSKGITNQQQSGRCWLFSGLNTLRSKVIEKYGMDEFEFSQNYLSFYDLVEKANIFLQRVIDTAKKPMNDKTVDWLFHNVIGDGGTYTGVADLINKYGVVPKEAMHETKSSNGTSGMQAVLGLKLREDGLLLRDAVAKGMKPVQLGKQKLTMLETIYRMLVLNLGVPPTQFAYTMHDSKGKPVSTETYTPQSFRDKFVEKDAISDYVMLMNDPTRPYYKTYQIDYDRQLYEGKDWTYVNLPVDDIKEMAIASLKDSTMMYFSCDVGKFLDSKRGLLDVDNYNYDALMGTSFKMDKKQRIESFASGSSHAMCLMAVDLNKDNKPTKWMVENSWGADRGYKGHLIMTDNWFNEYMFRLVVKKKYATAKVLDLLKQKPTLLPSWDPMYMMEE